MGGIFERKEFATTPARDPRPGDLLGKYRLVSQLDRGGMGIVWKAQAEGTGRQVAIKILPVEARTCPTALNEVEQSFQIVEGLTHHAICKAIDLEHDEAFGPYLILDYIAGRRLDEHVQTLRREWRFIGWADVVNWLLPIAEALDHAHSHEVRRPAGPTVRGVLHRDVKPANIMLRVDGYGQVTGSVLIDYGLASVIRQAVSRQTNMSVDTSGTLPYMAPEQLRGRVAEWTPRLDQYSLAVVAYELLAGQLPLWSENPGALREAIRSETPANIVGVPVAVNNALQRALAKDPAERHASCVAFLRAWGPDDRHAVPLCSPSQPAVTSRILHLLIRVGLAPWRILVFLTGIAAWCLKLLREPWEALVQGVVWVTIAGLVLCGIRFACLHARLLGFDEVPWVTPWRIRDQGEVVLIQMAFLGVALVLRLATFRPRSASMRWELTCPRWGRLLIWPGKLCLTLGLGLAVYQALLEQLTRPQFGQANLWAFESDPRPLAPVSVLLTLWGVWLCWVPLRRFDRTRLRFQNFVLHQLLTSVAAYGLVLSLSAAFVALETSQLSLWLAIKLTLGVVLVLLVSSFRTATARRGISHKPGIVTGVGIRSKRSLSLIETRV